MLLGDRQPGLDSRGQGAQAPSPVLALFHARNFFIGRGQPMAGGAREPKGSPDLVPVVQPRTVRLPRLDSIEADSFHATRSLKNEERNTLKLCKRA